MAIRPETIRVRLKKLLERLDDFRDFAAEILKFLDEKTPENK